MDGSGEMHYILFAVVKKITELQNYLDKRINILTIINKITKDLENAKKNKTRKIKKKS